MQLVNSGCLNMFKYIQKIWLKSSFLESLTSLDWLLYLTENELSGSRNSEWNLSDSDLAGKIDGVTQEYLSYPKYFHNIVFIKKSA